MFARIRLAAVCVATLLTLAPFSAVALAQDQPAQRPVMAIEHAGIDAMFPDDKDAAFLAALKRLAPRLKEIKHHPSLEGEMDEIPDEAIELLAAALGSPMRMAVTLGEVDPNSGMPNFGFTLSFAMPDEAGATAMHSRFETIRRVSEAPFQPEPSQRFAGMNDIAFPIGMLTYGPRKSPTGWRYEILFGAVENPDAASSYLPKARAGTTPVARAMLDLEALTPVSQMLAGLAAMVAPQGGAIMAELNESGMLGEGAMRVEMVASFDGGVGTKTFTVRRAARYAQKLRLPTKTLTAEALSVVPGDATVAQVRQMDIAAMFADLREQTAAMGAQEDFDEALAQFREMTGVDLEHDVIEALDGTFAAYLSDSTGAGSFLSGVVAARLSDPARIRGAIDKLALKANDAAANLEMGPGALAFETTRAGDLAMTSVRFRGLPIPITPTFAVKGDWLIAAATPQACHAAASLTGNAAKSLASNHAFGPAIKTHPAGYTSVDFIDVKRNLRSGYASLTLLTEALRNFTSAPGAGGADPGPIMAPFYEFATDVHPIMTTTSWSDEDLIVHMTGDRSTLVNVAGILGIGELGSHVIGALIGGGIVGAAADSGMLDHHNHEHWHDETWQDEDDEEDVEY